MKRAKHTYTVSLCEIEVIKVHAYQSGVDGKLFVWIDQQKDVSNVSLQKRRKKHTRMIKK